MSGIYSELDNLSQSDSEALDNWIHSKGRIVFVRLLSELSAGLSAAVSDTALEELSKYALTMAHKTGERKGVLTAGRYLNVDIPKYFKSKKERSGGE